MNDHCEIPRCRREGYVNYFGHLVCERHWDRVTADDASSDALRMALGIEPAPVAAMEEAMEPSTSKATKAEAAAEATSTKKPKAPKKDKAPKEPKPVKELTSTREPKKREEFNGEVVVFAFRLGSNDRDRIHAAAGPAGATRFVRSAAMAAATGDTKAFETLVAQARSNVN